MDDYNPGDAKRRKRDMVEVQVKLLDPFEQYKRGKEDYPEVVGRGHNPPSRNDEEFQEEFDHLGRKGEFGDHNFDTGCFRIFVDGRPLQNFTLTVQLIPRRTRYCFHESCDAISGDLATVGVTLFSNRGSPKVKALKNALQENDSHRPLLYIAYFALPREYRSTSSKVGPLILKEVLKIFEGEYSIAIYIPCGRSQYDAEDEALERRERDKDMNRPPDVEPTDEEILAEDKRDRRYRELTHQDMRLFFRARFRQVDDSIVVHKSKDSFVFITPQGALDPMLTEQQALDLPIASRSPPKPKTGLPRKLHNLLKQRCSIFEAISRARGSYIRPDELVSRHQHLEATLIDLGWPKSDIQLSREGFGPITDKLINSTSDAIEDLLNQCKVNGDRFGVILDSDALHICAAFQNLTFTKMLLNLLPEAPRQTTIAMNNLDVDGFTPLMIGARIISGKCSDPNVAKKSREFVESIMSLGADKNAVHPQTGLSALGYFREGRASASTFSAMFGFYPEHFETLRGGEVSRIEQILEPDQGPTASDDAVLYVHSNWEDDDDDDDEQEEEQFDY